MNRELLANIVENAKLAPSVHNTQPWKLGLSDGFVSVDIDPRFALKDGDPTGRQTILSLGIFCEALVISGKSLGYAAKNIDFSDNRLRIEFEENSTETESAKHMVGLLARRCTDRSLYKPADISPEFDQAIQGIALEDGIEVKIIKDRGQIAQIAELTSKGIRLALSNPVFREELSRFLVMPWSKNKRGISVRSLYIAWPLEVLQPILVKLGLSSKAEASIEKKRWLSSSCVVAILGDGDLSKYWFNAGRAYLRTSLCVENSGLSQATSAAIVEASNYHEDIENSLGTSKRILALIRVGKGASKRYYSPRVSTKELLT
jgi:hypothetical protein